MKLRFYVRLSLVSTIMSQSFHYIWKNVLQYIVVKLNALEKDYLLKNTYKALFRISCMYGTCFGLNPTLRWLTLCITSKGCLKTILIKIVWNSSSTCKCHVINLIVAADEGDFQYFWFSWLWHFYTMSHEDKRELSNFKHITVHCLWIPIRGVLHKSNVTPSSPVSLRQFFNTICTYFQDLNNVFK